MPSFDTKVAMLLLEAELGGPWADFYSELTLKPIAAASLGQVGPVWCIEWYSMVQYGYLN